MPSGLARGSQTLLAMTNEGEGPRFDVHNEYC
jgi:hypothetical protein